MASSPLLANNVMDLLARDRSPAVGEEDSFSLLNKFRELQRACFEQLVLYASRQLVGAGEVSLERHGLPLLF